MKENIILIGGGGHCRSCIDVIEAEGRFTIAGILDVNEKVGQSVLRYRIIASDNDLAAVINDYQYFFVTIGQIRSPSTRIGKFEQVAQVGGIFPVIISPRAYVSPYAKVGEGTIVMHGVIINAGAQVGRNCIINTGSIIEHDAVIEDHCHISTGATVNGGTIVKKRSFLGSNSVTKEYIVIKEDSFIKANSLVSGSYE